MSFTSLRRASDPLPPSLASRIASCGRCCRPHLFFGLFVRLQSRKHELDQNCCERTSGEAIKGSRLFCRCPNISFKPSLISVLRAPKNGPTSTISVVSSKPHYKFQPALTYALRAPKMGTCDTVAVALFGQSTYALRSPCIEDVPKSLEYYRCFRCIPRPFDCC